MSFSQNWFESFAKKNFETLKTLIDINKPLNFLEIGCFQGNCHLWMYDNILKNSDSKSTVIDPFEKSHTHRESNYNLFRSNLKNYLDKITICKGFSDAILPTLEKDSFDIIYIDGDHSALATYNDAVNSLPLLKKGGIIIFDDYLWHGLISPAIPNAHIGGTNHPAVGINKFIKDYEGQITIMDGFTPKCNVIDIEKLYCDLDYQSTYKDNFNYQMYCVKL